MNTEADQDVDVLAVTDSGDLHWTVVREQLDVANCTAITINLDDLRNIRFTARMGCLRLQVGGRNYVVSPGTSVWWRRPGSVDVSGLDDEEARLAYDEGPHLLLGALEQADVRMVGHPLVVAQSEIKLRQLAIARKLGITIPATLVTNEPESARSFSASHKIVAKAVSPGFGIAPYVAEVLDHDLDALKTLPTMLQELVPALADLRVIVVGSDSWVWRRGREPGTVDWRQFDPGGKGFSLAVNEEVSVAAYKVAAALGVTISVQDWLETDNDSIFLESNAHGAWLFLPGSQEVVAPAIARHLRVSRG